MNKGVRVSHSEMLAKQILDQYFGRFKKLDNAKPEWLDGLEIDRFYPTLGVAIEFQGDQHYRTVPGMHKDRFDFQRQVETDTKKRQLIENRGIQLYTINFLDLDRHKVINLVKTIVRQGKEFTRRSRNKQDFTKLQTVRTDLEPDSRLMRAADRVAKMRKTYYKQTSKRTPWWVRLIRKL